MTLMMTCCMIHSEKESRIRRRSGITIPGASQSTVHACFCLSAYDNRGFSHDLAGYLARKVGHVQWKMRVYWRFWKRRFSGWESRYAMKGLTVPGIQVRDGLCRIREQNVLFIDKRHPLHERIRILAETIGDFGNEEIFMPPVVRDLVDRTKSPFESPE